MSLATLLAYLRSAMTKAGTRTPITALQVQQATGQADVGGFMSPGQPVQAMHPEAGRQWDYPVGVNLQYTPRGNEAISFAQLRAIADPVGGYDLLRLAIETRKDQLVKFEWAIGPIDNKAGPDARCEELTDFFRRPDREHNWQQWLRAVLEDMLVIDAATLCPQMTRGGEVYALHFIDGATIKRVIDAQGHTPVPPAPAYQQIIKGTPATDYTAEEIIYAPRNVRSNKLYGLSPVEQVVMTVNIAMRRQIHQLQAYTEGNIPEALIGVPETWSVDQIKLFQEYWDSMHEGNTANRRHAKFIPGGLKYQPTKDQLLKDQYDEWLARIICYCFSLNPQAFVAQMNRATAETADAEARTQGLIPLKQWVKDLIDHAIWKYWGYRDLQFKWKDEDSVDPKVQAEIDDTNIRNGSVSIDEVRQSRGQEAIGMGHAVYTATGPVFVDAIKAQAEAAIDRAKNPAPPQPIDEPVAKAARNESKKKVHLY